MGVIFFEILYGTKATEQLHQAKVNNSTEQYNSILNNYLIQKENEFKSNKTMCFLIFLDNFYMKIMQEMLELNPLKRPIAFDILEQLISNDLLFFNN